MVPIHETDLKDESWSQVDWKNYELWEKVELRLKRKKRLWILGTLILFLVLSSIPIVIDRYPKWTTRSISRRLAQELNRVKRESSLNQSAHRFKFVSKDGFRFVVEKMASCDVSQGQVVWTGSLSTQGGRYAWISQSEGAELGIPGLVDGFCYDPFLGSLPTKKSTESVTSLLMGFGIAPVKDLSEKRMDRLTILLFSSHLAEFSFD